MIDLLDDEDLLDLGPRARRTDPAAVTREERSRHRDLPARNAALEAWEQGTPEPAPGPETATGACHLQDGRNARYRCTQCGHGACAAHFWVMFGLCTRCAKEERVARWHDEAQPETDNWLEDAGT